MDEVLSDFLKLQMKEFYQTCAAAIGEYGEDFRDMEYRKNVLCYEDYCELRESVGWPLWAEEQVRSALANSACTVIAVDQGKTVGMGRLIGDGLYYIAADIVVRPDYQKRGIGTNIMKLLLAYAEEKTPDHGRSSVQLIAEKGKEPFYETLGFKLLPHEFCGAGMRKVIWKN